MAEFDYIAVLVSIIIGLGLTHLLGGVGEMVSRRGEYKLDPVHVLWTITTFFILTLNWWVFFQSRKITDWTYGYFMMVAIWSVIGYMMAVVLFPRRLAAGESYGEVFERNRRWFMGLLIAYTFADIGLTAMRGDLFHPPEYLPFVLHLALLGLLGIFIRGRKFQLGLAIYVLAIGTIWSFMARYLLAG